MQMTSDPDSEFTGKYESGGRVGGILVDRFYGSVERLLKTHASPGDVILEVGSGAGYSTERIIPWLPEGTRYAGSDIGESLLRKASARNPSVPFLRQSVYGLAVPDKSVDVVVMLEVLEHLDRPMQALQELRRVVRKAVILSTPREPLWRLLNMARGKYWSDLGNTPGHLQHWSSIGLRRQVSSCFDVVGMSQPIPWTVLALVPRQ